MASLDARIDDLYKGSPAEFVAARNALAKSLTGDEAKAVTSLKKPLAVPWAVNQLYWRARPVYDRLMKSGQRLRAAQIAGLKGRQADVRGATEAHRAVLQEAAKETERLASDAHPESMALSQMLEALSLVESPAERPGRFTTIVRPSGFEALEGVAGIPAPAPDESERQRESQEKAAARRAEQRARDKAIAVDRGERAVEKARTLEKRTRVAWERADAALKNAERTLERLKAR